jgi:hypothetical protein
VTRDLTVIVRRVRDEALKRQRVGKATVLPGGNEARMVVIAGSTDEARPRILIEAFRDRMVARRKEAA